MKEAAALPSKAPPTRGDIVTQVLAGIDRSGKWTPLTLELLGDATALAGRWQGQVGAWVLTGLQGPVPDMADLAAHGCDRVDHLRNERFAPWCSEASAAALARHLSPACRVIFLPADSRGEEVAALLAEHLQAIWIPDVLTLSVTRADVLEITATLPGGKLSRVYRPHAGSPVIVTMRPGVPEARRLDRPRSMSVAEVDIDLSDIPSLTRVEQFLPADPQTVDITFADRIVSAGRGAGGPEGVRLVAGLADALQAALGASRLIVDLGWAPAQRQVGQTGRTVHPDLYVACGISGASHHLAGMRTSKHIVAINPDASAPIHDVAHLSLHGDLHQLIPAIHAALQRRGRPGPTPVS